jgi:hypothetical protein
MWQGGAADGAPQEFREATKFTSVLDSYKAKSADITNVIVVVKDGFSTSEFVQEAKQFPYLKDKILGSSVIYTNVVDGFDLSTFESRVGAH